VLVYNSFIFSTFQDFRKGFLDWSPFCQTTIQRRGLILDPLGNTPITPIKYYNPWENANLGRPFWNPTFYTNPSPNPSPDPTFLSNGTLMGVQYYFDLLKGSKTRLFSVWTEWWSVQESFDSSQKAEWISLCKCASSLEGLLLTPSCVAELLGKLNSPCIPSSVFHPQSSGKHCI